MTDLPGRVFFLRGSYSYCLGGCIGLICDDVAYTDDGMVMAFGPRYTTRERE